MRWGEGVWNCLRESILQLLTGKWVFLSEWEWEVLPSASDLVYAWAVRCSLRTYSKLTSSCSTLRSRGTLWISLTQRFLEKSPTCISLCANITTENICTAIRARMKLLYKCIAATKTFVHAFKYEYYFNDGHVPLVVSVIAPVCYFLFLCHWVLIYNSLKSVRVFKKNELRHLTPCCSHFAHPLL